MATLFSFAARQIREAIPRGFRRKADKPTRTIQVCGGVSVEVTHDEWLLFEAYLVVRKGNKDAATRKAIIRAIRYRMDLQPGPAKEWFEQQLEPLLARGILVELGPDTLTRGDGKTGPAVTRRRSIVRTYGSSCVYCGVFITGKRLTLDHVVPKAKGGSDRIENLRPCCPECNQSKRDRTPEEWADDIRRVSVAG